MTSLVSHFFELVFYLQSNLFVHTYQIYMFGLFRGPWSECTGECGAGQRIRSRDVIDDYEFECHATEEIGQCFHEQKCTEPGQWVIIFYSNQSVNIIHQILPFSITIPMSSSYTSCRGSIVFSCYC